MAFKNGIKKLILLSIMVGVVSFILWFAIVIWGIIPRGIGDTATFFLLIVFAIPTSLFVAKGMGIITKFYYFLISAFIIFAIFILSFIGFLYMFWAAW
jgi:hypothetical protein